MINKGAIKILFLLLIMIVLSISAIMFSFDSHNVSEQVQNKAQETLKDGGELVMNKVAEEGKNIVGEKLKETGEKMMATENAVPGTYQKFIESSVMQYEKNILFFTAPWCPSCIEIEAHFVSQKNEIPASLAIQIVDFDVDQQLREKYHVDRPHTFVQIDQSGNEVGRWHNDTTLSEVLSHVQ